MALAIDALLAAPRETLAVEHKSWLDLTDQHDRGTLAKALIALANHGGGHVVIGIAEAEGGVKRYAVDRPTGIAPYTQETIAALVKKFVEPAFDCALETAVDPSTGIELAVLSVPADIPDVVMSKSGVPNGPITEHRVYIRKPGPASEMPTTVGEWRTLFDRCVKARQTDMLDAIRAIVTGAPTQAEGNLVSDAEAHRAFVDDARSRWEALIAAKPTDAGERMPHGRWEFGVSFVGDFERPTLAELDRRLRSAGTVKHSGWPPFLYLNPEPYDPRRRV